MAITDCIEEVEKNTLSVLLKCFVSTICISKYIVCVRACLLIHERICKWNLVYPHTLVSKGFGWINEVCRLVNHGKIKQFIVSGFYHKNVWINQ